MPTDHPFDGEVQKYFQRQLLPLWPALSYCPHWLEKQQQIDRLNQEIAQLKARLRYQERTARERDSFGSSTPSAKLPVPGRPESLRLPF